jgi:hypothetical protein
MLTKTQKSSARSLCTVTNGLLKDVHAVLKLERAMLRLMMHGMYIR